VDTRTPALYTGDVNDVIPRNGNEREDTIDLDNPKYDDKEYQDLRMQRRGVSQKKAKYVVNQGIVMSKRMKELYGYRDEL